MTCRSKPGFANALAALFKSSVAPAPRAAARDFLAAPTRTSTRPLESVATEVPRTWPALDPRDLRLVVAIGRMILATVSNRIGCVPGAPAGGRAAACFLRESRPEEPVKHALYWHACPFQIGSLANLDRLTGVVMRDLVTYCLTNSSNHPGASGARGSAASESAATDTHSFESGNRPSGRNPDSEQHELRSTQSDSSRRRRAVRRAVIRQHPVGSADRDRPDPIFNMVVVGRQSAVVQVARQAVVQRLARAGTTPSPRSSAAAASTPGSAPTAGSG